MRSRSALFSCAQRRQISEKIGGGGEGALVTASFNGVPRTSAPLKRFPQISFFSFASRVVALSPPSGRTKKGDKHNRYLVPPVTAGVSVSPITASLSTSPLLERHFPRNDLRWPPRVFPATLPLILIHLCESRNARDAVERHTSAQPPHPSSVSLLAECYGELRSILNAVAPLGRHLGEVGLRRGAPYKCGVICYSSPKRSSPKTASLPGAPLPLFRQHCRQRTRLVHVLNTTL